MPAQLSLDLETAVVDWLRSDQYVAPALGDTPADQRIWSKDAPREVPLPWVIVRNLGDEMEWESDGTGVGTHTLKITVHGGEQDQVVTIKDLIAAALKDAPLAFAGGQLLYLRRESRTPDLDPDPAPEGVDCFSDFALFKALVECST